MLGSELRGRVKNHDGVTVNSFEITATGMGLDDQRQLSLAIDHKAWSRS